MQCGRGNPASRVQTATPCSATRRTRPPPLGRRAATRGPAAHPRGHAQRCLQPVDVDACRRFAHSDRMSSRSNLKPSGAPPLFVPQSQPSGAAVASEPTRPSNRKGGDLTCGPLLIRHGEVAMRVAVKTSQHGGKSNSVAIFKRFKKLHGSRCLVS